LHVLCQPGTCGDQCRRAIRLEASLDEDVVVIDPDLHAQHTARFPRAGKPCADILAFRQLSDMAGLLEVIEQRFTIYHTHVIALRLLLAKGATVDADARRPGSLPQWRRRCGPPWCGDPD